MNKLNIFLDFGKIKHFVGKLFYSDKLGKIVFNYDENFLSKGLKISPKNLPLGNDTFVAELDPDQYNLHGVFADSLPDTWGKLMQDAEFERIKLYNANAIDRLAFVGKYGIGALKYEPTKEFKKGKQITDIADLRKAAQNIIKGELDTVASELIRMGGSAGGARPKFLVALSSKDKNKIKYFSDKLTDSMIPVLIKVPTKEDFWQRIEYVYSQMAQNGKINIPSTYLLISRSKRAYFAIERFDICQNGKRLHAHTYANLDGFSIKQENRDYLDLCRITKALCNDYRSLEEIFRRMVFNYLGDNQDDHGKNFSFLMDSSGNWTLSPAYDIGYSDNGGIHRMTVNGKRSSLRLKDLEQFAKKINIKNWQPIIKDIISSLKKWDNLAQKALIPAKLIEKISNRIQININRIEKAI